MIQTELKWWDKIVIPMRKVWVRISTNIGFRKNGLMRLGKEVRTCEYEDVHILWDMLKRNEARSRSRSSRKGAHYWWKFHCSPLLSRSSSSSLLV